MVKSGGGNKRKNEDENSSARNRCVRSRYSAEASQEEVIPSSDTNAAESTLPQNSLPQHSLSFVNGGPQPSASDGAHKKSSSIQSSSSFANGSSQSQASAFRENHVPHAFPTLFADPREFFGVLINTK